MGMTHTLGVHEALELCELVTFKSLCLTKTTTMSPLAQDPVLKDILNRDADTTRSQLERLQAFLPPDKTERDQ